MSFLIPLKSGKAKHENSLGYELHEEHTFIEVHSIHGIPLSSRHFLAKSRCSKMLRNGRVQARADRRLNSEAGVEGRVMWWLNEQHQEYMNQHLGLWRADEQEGTEISSFIHSHCPSANFVPSSTLTSGNKVMNNGGLPDPKGFSTRS